jgi:hypothetical protein
MANQGISHSGKLKPHLLCPLLSSSTSGELRMDGNDEHPNQITSCLPKITGPNLFAPYFSLSAIVIKQFGWLFSALTSDLGTCP